MGGVLIDDGSRSEVRVSSSGAPEREDRVVLLGRDEEDVLESVNVLPRPWRLVPLKFETSIWPGFRTPPDGKTAGTKTKP